MAKGRKRKRPDTADNADPVPNIKFHYGFLSLLGSLAGLSLASIVLLLLINLVFGTPFLSIIVFFIMTPFISGFIAGRFVIRRDTWLLGILGGVVWSGLEFVLLFSVLMNIPMMSPMTIGRIEIFLLALVAVLNCFFTLLGLRISAKPNKLLQLDIQGE